MNSDDNINLKSKQQQRIIIPVNETTITNLSPSQKRIGIAKGKFNTNEDFDSDNQSIYESMINE